MISIEAKLDAIHRGLDQVKDETKYLDLDILRKLGRGIVSKSKSTYKVLLTRQSGAMYKGIVSRVFKPQKIVVVSNIASNPKTGARYPFILAHGATIAPKKAKTLSFNIGGKWISTHGPIKVPVHDWIERPGNQYMSSNKADDDIEYVIEYAINQLKKKGVLA